MKQLGFLLLLLFAGSSCAQSLSVNGREVAGLTLSLVEGVSYAPAGQYADAMGARMTIDYGSGLVSLELGGRLVVLPTYTEVPGEGVTGTWSVNGISREGQAAIFDEGQLYLPVSAVAQGLLGYTTYVPGRGVMVVLPRGRIEDLDAQRRGNSDRLVVTLSSNVPYILFYNEPLNSLELRFDRTDSDGVGAVTEGRYFTRAAARTSQGAAEVRVSLEDDVDYSLYTVPAGRGYQLVIDLFQAVEEEQLAAAPEPRVVIDAAHGGDDPGMALAGSSEGRRTLEISRLLAGELRERGLEVALSRVEDHDLPLSIRSGSGVGADLFLSLHVHPTPDGVISVYYLEEAGGAAGLDMAVRQNAEDQLQGDTDELRRRLLLNLVPDLDVGRRYAEGLRGEVVTRGNFRVANPQPAPLAILAGAAGRGLLIEVPDEVTGSEATQEELVSALADALATLLLGQEARR